jgi:hypothetical protein
MFRSGKRRESIISRVYLKEWSSVSHLFREHGKVNDFIASGNNGVLK